MNSAVYNCSPNFVQSLDKVKPALHYHLLLVNHFGSNSLFLSTSKMVMPVSKTLLSSLLRTTTSPVLLARSFASPALYHNVNDIVERFKSVNIPGWQSKIGATYYFKVEDGSSFLVDLKVRYIVYLC